MTDDPQNPDTPSLIERLMPEASPEERDAARDTLLRYITVVLRILDRERRELGTSDSLPGARADTIRPEATPEL